MVCCNIVSSRTMKAYGNQWNIVKALPSYDSVMGGAASFGVRQLAAAFGQIDGSHCGHDEKRQQAAALQKTPHPSWLNRHRSPCIAGSWNRATVPKWSGDARGNQCAGLPSRLISTTRPLKTSTTLDTCGSFIASRTSAALARARGGGDEGRGASSDRSRADSAL